MHMLRPRFVSESPPVLDTGTLHCARCAGPRQDSGHVVDYQLRLGLCHGATLARGFSDCNEFRYLFVVRCANDVR